MTSRTHEVGAVVGLMAGMAYFGVPNVSAITVGVALIANLVGSLLPDIDQHSNRLWGMFPGGNTVGKVGKKLFMGHRSLSDSFLGMFIAYMGLIWILPKILNNEFVDIKIVMTAMLIGYSSHLFLDGFTQEGLPLFFPIKWKFGFPPFKKLRIRTGKFVETWIVFPILVISIFMLTALLFWQNKSL